MVKLDQGTFLESVEKEAEVFLKQIEDAETGLARAAQLLSKKRGELAQTNAAISSSKNDLSAMLSAGEDPEGILQNEAKLSDRVRLLQKVIDELETSVCVDFNKKIELAKKQVESIFKQKAGALRNDFCRDVSISVGMQLRLGFVGWHSFVKKLISDHPEFGGQIYPHANFQLPGETSEFARNIGIPDGEFGRRAHEV